MGPARRELVGTALLVLGLGVFAGFRSALRCVAPGVAVQVHARWDFLEDPWGRTPAISFYVGDPRLGPAYSFGPDGVDDSGPAHSVAWSNRLGTAPQSPPSEAWDDRKEGGAAWDAHWASLIEGDDVLLEYHVSPLTRHLAEPVEMWLGAACFVVGWLLCVRPRAPRHPRLHVEVWRVAALASLPAVATAWLLHVVWPSIAQVSHIPRVVQPTVALLGSTCLVALLGAVALRAAAPRGERPAAN